MYLFCEYTGSGNKSYIKRENGDMAHASGMSVLFKKNFKKLSFCGT